MEKSLTLGQIVWLIPGKRQKVKLIFLAGKKTIQRQFASAQGMRGYQ